MTRPITLICMLFWIAPSFAQQDDKNHFDTLLQNKIKEAKIRMDSMALTKKRKGCLGWTLEIISKPKTKDTTVTFHVGKTLETLADKPTNPSPAKINSDLLYKP